MKKFIVMAVAVFLVACGSGSNLDGKTFKGIFKITGIPPVAQEWTFKSDKVMMTGWLESGQKQSAEMFYSVEDGKVKCYKVKGGAADFMLDIQKDGNLLEPQTGTVLTKQ